MELISKEEAAKISEARVILRAIQKRMPKYSFSDGVVHEAAEVAQDSIFDFLNVASTYGESKNAGEVIELNLSR